MIFNEHGDKTNPCIILIHGGGVSDWMWEKQIEALKNSYFIVSVILDGHGQDFSTVFKSIKVCAEKIVKYIDDNFDGKIFAICGLSIGAQITVQIISDRKDICQKAVIESALVIPMKMMSKIAGPLFGLSFPLIKNKQFAKLQSKSLYISEDQFEKYFYESSRMSKASLVNFIKSNSEFGLPLGIYETKTNCLILCGNKEPGIMKKSSKKLSEVIHNSSIEIVENAGHGISLQYPDLYIDKVKQFLKQS